MNLQAYADHRKARGLRGSSHVAVLNAINDGRLTAPAVRRNGRNWIIDAAAADQQWAARTDPSPVGNMPAAAFAQAPAAAQVAPDSNTKGLPALSVSKAVKAAYDAKLAQLQYQKDAEEVGSIAEMRREAFALGKAIREGVLGVVARVSADLAAMTDQLEVERRLEEELIVALRSLADG